MDSCHRCGLAWRVVHSWSLPSTFSSFSSRRDLSLSIGPHINPHIAPPIYLKWRHCCCCLSLPTALRMMRSLTRHSALTMPLRTSTLCRNPVTSTAARFLSSFEVLHHLSTPHLTSHRLMIRPQGSPCSRSSPMCLVHSTASWDTSGSMTSILTTSSPDPPILGTPHASLTLYSLNLITTPVVQTASKFILTSMATSVIRKLIN